MKPGQQFLHKVVCQNFVLQSFIDQNFVVVVFLILLNFFNRCSIDGVVVCQEFEQVLLDAWREEEEQAEKRKAEVTYSALSYLLLRDHMTSNDQNIFPPKVS